MYIARSRLRWGALSVSLALCSVLLAACGGSDDEGTPGSEASASEALKVLSDDELTHSLLTSANMGPGFKEVAEDDSEDDGDLGCFNDVADAFDEVDEDDDIPSASTQYDATTDFEVPSVSMSTASFDSIESANNRFDRFRDALDGCHSINVTEDETTTKLSVEVDDTPYTNLVDEQLNITATGTVNAGLEFPVYLALSVSRIDNNVAFFGFTDLVEDVGDAPRTYATALADRLAAVVGGETVSDALITVSDPGDSEGLPSDEDTAAGSAVNKLPLDGGSYTWASGIKMTLSVQTVEPYGEKDDFCGDGSCGIALPDDTRVAIKYEVSVPDDYADSFDPYNCPGELHVASGNDDDALGSVAGDLYRSLDGSILPGTTKFGVEEYYIKQDYIDEEFYIESSCGDDSYDESAFFAGTFAS